MNYQVTSKYCSFFKPIAVRQGIRIREFCVKNVRILLDLLIHKTFIYKQLPYERSRTDIKSFTLTTDHCLLIAVRQGIRIREFCVKKSNEWYQCWHWQAFQKSRRIMFQLKGNAFFRNGWNAQEIPGV